MTGRKVEWVCEYCGYSGRSDADDDAVDSIQCPVCGEPVTPTG